MRLVATISVCSFLVFSPVLFALSPRVFVASNGVDTGTCPRTAPCRTFAYGMTQVAPAGELVALDTAGYGPVTINMSVSIYAAPGALASITAVSGNDITVAASASDRVFIRGLFLTSNGSVKGISFESGDVLTVQDTTFANFTASLSSVAIEHVDMLDGVVASPKLFVTNCRFFNTTNGVYVASSLHPTRVSIRGSNFEAIGQKAVYLGTHSRATITDSTFTANGWGVQVTGSGSSAEGSAYAAVERSTFLDNAVALSASASGQTTGLIHAAYCMIASNDVGIEALTGGAVLSRADGTSNQTNTLELNDTGNSFSGPYAAK